MPKTPLRSARGTLVRGKQGDGAGTEHHLLPKNAQARVDPLRVLPWEMTVLWLMVPPALCNVLPKMAKKMIGAITLLKAKKNWTLV